MKKDDIKVSIICTAYNHEKFLRKCLEGFVMQKTNFKFEAIIHDDASTDGTKAIIQEFESKYPDIIVPIYQKENQHSKKVRIMDDIMIPKARGKYIALCEGDDYWCNENKLQLQYDFMESHPEFSACFTNTIFHDLRGIQKDRNYNNYTELRIMTPYDAMNSGVTHTSTHFVRKEFSKKVEFGYKFPFGDFVRQTSYYLNGPMAILPDITSVYNAFNPNGMTNEVFSSKDPQYIINRVMEVKDYLDIYNEYTNFKYDTDIKFLYGEQIIGAYQYAIERCPEYKKRIQLYKNLRKEPTYLWYKKNIKGMKKLKEIIRGIIPLFLYDFIKQLRSRNGKQ